MQNLRTPLPPLCALGKSSLFAAPQQQHPDQRSLSPVRFASSNPSARCPVLPRSPVHDAGPATRLSPSPPISGAQHQRANNLLMSDLALTPEPYPLALHWSLMK